MESSMYIGSGTGPILGSILYNLFGYFYTFIIMGLSFIIILPFLWWFQPPNIDEDGDEVSSLIRSNETEVEMNLDMCTLTSSCLIKLCAF